MTTSKHRYKQQFGQRWCMWWTGIWGTVRKWISRLWGTPTARLMACLPNRYSAL